MERKTLAGTLVMLCMVVIVALPANAQHSANPLEGGPYIISGINKFRIVRHLNNLIERNEMEVPYYQPGLDDRWKVKIVSRSDYKTLRILAEGNLEYYENLRHGRDKAYQEDPQLRVWDKLIAEDINIDFKNEFESYRFQRFYAERYIEMWKRAAELYRNLEPSSGLEPYSENINSLGGVDFTTTQLNYISTLSDPVVGTSFFSYVTKSTGEEKGDKAMNIVNASEQPLEYFFIGLTLSNQKFWVNLNPWEPDRIVDDDVGRTDVGRIMLEADLQMKKDFCKYENPCSSRVGDEYWQLLDKKQEELVTGCMRQYPGEIEKDMNVLFPAATRYWIVPDEITAYGNENEVYIVNSTLTIKTEPVYEHSVYEIVNQGTSKVSDGCRRCLDDALVEYGRYATELEEEMIYPLVAQEVNNNENYSELRQVYSSLALAQWYKSHGQYASTIFSDFIDWGELEGLESQTAWDATEIWKSYVKSHNEGEYNCQKEETYRKGRYTITEYIIYSSGGVDFSDVDLTVIGELPYELKEVTTDAIYTPFRQEGNEYYFGDSLYVLSPITSTDEILEEEEEELKGTCGPTAIVLLAMLPMFGVALLRKKNKRKIIES